MQPWQGIDVGSPFDYPQQAILYVARHLPPPGRDGSGNRDSAAVLLASPGFERLDTVARLSPLDLAEVVGDAGRRAGLPRSAAGAGTDARSW